MSLRALFAGALLLLAGCSRDEGAPTSEQNRGLDEAADLLNEAPSSLEKVDDTAVRDLNSIPGGNEVP